MHNLENMSVEEIDKIMSKIEVTEIPPILKQLKLRNKNKYSKLIEYQFRKFFKESYNHQTRSTDNHSPLSDY